MSHVLVLHVLTPALGIWLRLGLGGIRISAWDVAEAVAGRCVERMEGAVVSAWDVAEAVVECSIRH